MRPLEEGELSQAAAARKNRHFTALALGGKEGSGSQKAQIPRAATCIRNSTYVCSVAWIERCASPAEAGPFNVSQHERMQHGLAVKVFCLTHKARVASSIDRSAIGAECTQLSS